MALKFYNGTSWIDLINGSNDGTNWTSITINGITKNIPSGGSGGGITEISTQYIRIWDLNPGIYKLTYAGTKYLYYYGASGTQTHTVVGGSGQVILTVQLYNTNTKYWFYDSYNAGTWTRYFGNTSSTLGSTSSVKMMPKYQHEVIFTVYGSYTCRFVFYNNTSGVPTPKILADLLKGQVLTDLSVSNASHFIVFGDNDGDRLDPAINFTRFWDGGSYTSSTNLVVSSHTSTQL